MVDKEFKITHWIMDFSRYMPRRGIAGSYSKRYMHSSVHCNTVYKGQDLGATQMSTGR